MKAFGYRLYHIAECAVCKQRYLGHVGSTPCCGSVAYVVGYKLHKDLGKVVIGEKYDTKQEV